MKKSFLKKLLKFFGFYKEKEYLDELINNIESIYLNEKKTVFTIHEPRQRGFIVKVGGLFAFASFGHMPWRYPSVKYWSVVAKHLIGKRFYCKIHKFKRKPLLVLIDGKEHLFRDVELKKFHEYQGVVLQKFKNGLFVDIGYHFQWEYGSFLGYIHKRDMSKEMTLLEEGEETLIRYNGYSTNRDIKFTDVNIPVGWYNGDLEMFVGTTQDVSVTLNKENRRDYIIQGKYHAITPTTREFYGDNYIRVEKQLKEMNINTRLKCMVMSVNRNDRTLIIKILF